MTKVLKERLSRAYHRYGLFSLSKKLPLLLYNRIFKNRTIVYVYDKTKVSCSNVNGVAFEKYYRAEDIREEYILQLSNEEGKTHLENLFSLFANRSILYLVLIGKEVIGYWWISKGKHIERWFIPLEDEDLVFYSAVVFRSWRGQSIASNVLAAIVPQELKSGYSAYLDIKEWNGKAIKSFSKAGFVPFR